MMFLVAVLVFVATGPAARNMLVSRSTRVLVSDFGMSKKLQSNSDLYRITGSGEALLPVRWLGKTTSETYGYRDRPSGQHLLIPLHYVTISKVCSEFLLSISISCIPILTSIMFLISPC